MPYVYDLTLGMPHTNHRGLSEPLLLMQAALAGNDHARATALIDWFTQRLQKDTLQTTAELIAHAALPALDVEPLEPATLALLDKAAKNLVNAKADPRANALQLHLARHQLDRTQRHDALHRRRSRI